MQEERVTNRATSGPGVSAAAGAAVKRLPAGPGNGAAAGRGREGVSRQRVIEAAIQSILKLGFYRASSNAIAEQAGVSWGVIQYHFGTREALMVAVLEEGNRRFNEVLVNSDISGETVTERVAQLLDILVRCYGSMEYLAFNQVLLNLTHDPRTSQQTREAMARINESANPEFNRLMRKVLAGTGIRRPAIRHLLFHSLRGLVLSHLMLETLPDRQGEPQRYPEQRKLLAQALGLLIEVQGSARS